MKIEDNLKKIIKHDKDIENLGSQLDTKANEVALEVERKRIDSFTSLTSGSTTGDAELIDGRIGADGKTYSNIGGAIRGQFSKVNGNLDKLFLNSPNLFDSSLYHGSSLMGVTMAYDDTTGYLTINGTCTGVGAFWKDFIFNTTGSITASIRYVSGSISGSGIQFDLYNIDNVGTPIGTATSTFTTGSILSKTITNINLKQSRIYVKSGTICNNLVIAIQVENGTSVSEYLKYGGKINNFLDKTYLDKITEITNNQIITDAKQDLGYFNKGAVVICVDDGTEYDKPNIWNLVKEYNVPFVFAMMKECKVCQDSTLLSEVKELVTTYKCEICQHGTDTMSSWNVLRVNNYFKEQVDFFTVNGIQINNFVAPQNETSINMRCVGQNYFDMMFSEFPNKNGVTIENKNRTNRYKLSRTSITPGYGTAHYFPRMLRTKTEGLLYVMYVHSVALNDNTYVQLVRDILDYAKSNSITITTFRDFYNNY